MGGTSAAPPIAASGCSAIGDASRRLGLRLCRHVMTRRSSYFELRIADEQNWITEQRDLSGLMAASLANPSAEPHPGQGKCEGCDPDDASAVAVVGA